MTRSLWVLAILCTGLLVVAPGCRDDVRGEGSDSDSDSDGDSDGDGDSDSDADGDSDSDTASAAVYGSIHFSGQQCGGDFAEFSGSLAEDGADFFGYCHRTGDDLDLVVGTNDLEQATNSTDFYLAMTGIVGPPVEGVYDGGGDPKDEESLFTSFESVIFKNVNVHEFELADSDDFSIEGLCDIVLYATPIAGEQNPDGDGFEIFTAMDCGGIDAPATTDETIVLNYLEFELWLDGCS